MYWKPLLSAVNLALAFGMYIPLWTRILRRRSTADFSKLAYWMVFAIQLVNLALAVLEDAPYLAVLYIVHAGFVGFTVYLVYRFYGGANDS